MLSNELTELNGSQERSQFKARLQDESRYVADMTAKEAAYCDEIKKHVEELIKATRELISNELCLFALKKWLEHFELLQKANASSYKVESVDELPYSPTVKYVKEC